MAPRATRPWAPGRWESLRVEPPLPAQGDTVRTRPVRGRPHVLVGGGFGAAHPVQQWEAGAQAPFPAAALGVLPRVVMILPQVHLRKPCYDFTFL